MNTYKKLFGYAPEKKHLAYVSAVLSTTASILAVLPFWYLWRFLEKIIVHRDNNSAMHYAVIIVSLLVAYGITYFLSLWASHILAFRLESNMRKVGTRHLMDASFAFFDVNSSGTIRKIIDDNATQTHMIVAHLIPDITAAFTIPVFLFITMFAVDIRLGILTLFLAIIGVLQLAAMMGGKDFMTNYMKSLDKMNAEAVEYVRGMQVVKIFRADIASFKNFYKTIKDYSAYALNYSMSCRRPYVIFQIIFNIIVAIAVPFAVYFINRGEDIQIILAKIVFFACFSGAVFVCFMKIMFVSMYGTQANQAVEKLENLFAEMEKGKPLRGNRTEMTSSDIEFKNVSFKYGEEYVIKDLSLTLKERKTYALVGSSGGGKSTLAKLISGFYAVNEGEICIGGHPVSDYTEDAIMKNIAFVFQNSKLFKTSIYENVKIGNPKASKEEVMKALSLACCDDILAKFPERENTIIGAKGVHLSGGETQRIAIARAILKNAKIVILDEASAAADPENEYEIQRAFSSLMKDKTVIMIAHRLSSIRNADEILVVDGGKIIERGTDKELMAANGRYKEFQDMFAKATDWRVYD